ncbi:Plant-specific TFIIB-related protein 1 [Sesamum angolense]|uniref:Plant-specific TFIIB-related protein 1 n=1 Tax=Sesamum angolense TaxID=2727404 RepID=A0AAE1WI46_9LAMI|nr:Plant-specific TFIIB-related protein 1 [Sesamum angolense]
MSNSERKKRPILKRTKSLNYLRLRVNLPLSIPTEMRCPYCSSGQGRCATTAAGRSITSASCGRVVEERQTQPHHLFHLRAQDNPLCLVTSDLPSAPVVSQNDDEDPFEPTGFITAFSTWSLEPYPVFAHSSLSFAGHLAELERVLETTSQGNNSSASGPSVVVDNLRAYLQIIDVASILGLDYDISDHAFQLFRDCSSATCLRNRSVEALATAALVQAIREAQEPRTLQEISIAANLPQKEIGKYIKILGEALQLSQPINSNSISVHMPRFCTLLQLNKSAQELATHIGEVVINKCFCTRRNPISISAAAIYLACQLEDKRKTQAEICKVTGLTEVTLRKVYKELLENWDDLLPSNYNPVVPPEKAFPTATISSGRSSSSRCDLIEGSPLDREKHTESRLSKPSEILALLGTPFWKPQVPVSTSANQRPPETNQISTQNMEIDILSKTSEEKGRDTDTKTASSSLRPIQFPAPPALAAGVVPWPFRPPVTSSLSPSGQFIQQPKAASTAVDKGPMQQNLNERFS